MPKSYKGSFCPKCGCAGIKSGLCPKCGTKIKRSGASSMPSFMKNKKIAVPVFLILFMVGGVVFLFFTNENVATELRQVRQPMPNSFFLGIDVSATISTDTLEKLKDAAIERLSHFVGDEAVSYNISTFGNPGCASRSFSEIVSTSSPKDAVTFSWKVEEKIRKISITKVAPRDTTPLTTPFYHFLEKILPERSGSRIIVFSDLMNDDSDCPDQYIFPEQVITDFGADKNGQIIFLYPTPHLTNNDELNERILKKQQEFIDKMNELSSQGKVRAFFYHIPDDPLERIEFIKTQLQNSIPTTMFDIVFERAAKVFSTIVSAVRG